jgi:hypothetical protein
VTTPSIAAAFAGKLRRFIDEKAYLDPAAFSEMVADEVVLHTLRFWRPVTDRNWMIGILSMVPQAIEGFAYHRQWIEGNEVVMEFDGKVGDKALHGIDIFTLNERGQISSLTVFIRPPNGLEALAEREDALLQQMFGVARQDDFVKR